LLGRSLNITANKTIKCIVNTNAGKQYKNKTQNETTKRRNNKKERNVEVEERKRRKKKLW